jgi:transcription elongation factor GreB
MSKAFTKEGDGDGPDDDLDDLPDDLPPSVKNLMTPPGYEKLRAELHFLLHDERPKITEIVSWAAGNGDRSENGDYLYNKKRLREIDRRIRYLTKRLESAEIVDPARQQGLEQVFFGATVTYVKEDGLEITVQLVGIDEANLEEGKINWQSPVARALMKLKVGDAADVRAAGGIETIEVVEILYKVDA